MTIIPDGPIRDGAYVIEITPNDEFGKRYRQIENDKDSVVLIVSSFGQEDGPYIMYQDPNELHVIEKPSVRELIAFFSENS